MNLVDRILSQPIAYRLWMMPFAARKLESLAKHNDLRSVRRVLDVGCGPGTNAPAFEHAEYVGVDLNPSYIESARKRFGRNFLVADVRGNAFPVGSGFDCILVNSLLHHIDLASTSSLLRRLTELLTPDGFVHIIELVLPERISVARALARADRGNYARPLGDWKTIFSEHFEPVVFEPFTQRNAGVTLYELVYFKGRALRRQPVPAGAV
jgi:SAM-dependent methyltransferase